MINQKHINEMLEVNKSQKDYYEYDTSKEFQHEGNIYVRTWDKIRDYQYKMTDYLDINNQLFNIHLEWLGNLNDKKVLDLGCHNGNELSLYLAKNSASYFGVDLSKGALSVLENKFKEANISNAKVLDLDILSDDFPEKDFDVIYAKAIFHHFKYFEDFLQVIKTKVKKGGIIITSDPLNTYFPLRFIHYLYRFIQYDKNWEYPFSKKSIMLIDKHFRIEK